jgi:hypothetical protein
MLVFPVKKETPPNAERAKNSRRSKDKDFIPGQDSFHYSEIKILDQRGNENGVNPVFLVGKQGILWGEEVFPCTLNHFF